MKFIQLNMIAAFLNTLNNITFAVEKQQK